MIPCIGGKLFAPFQGPHFPQSDWLDMPIQKRYTELAAVTVNHTSDHMVSV
jgi:hypothetical protein